MAFRSLTTNAPGRVMSLDGGQTVTQLAGTGTGDVPPAEFGAFIVGIGGLGVLKQNPSAITIAIARQTWMALKSRCMVLIPSKAPRRGPGPLTPQAPPPFRAGAFGARSARL